MGSSVIKVDKNYSLACASFALGGNNSSVFQIKITADPWNSLIYKDGDGGFGLIIVKDNQTPTFITLNNSTAFTNIKSTVSNVSGSSFQCSFLGNRRYQLIGSNVICTQLS